MVRGNIEASRVTSNRNTNTLPSYADIQPKSINQASNIPPYYVGIDSPPEYSQVFSLPSNPTPQYDDCTSVVSCETEFLLNGLPHNSSYEDIVDEYNRQVISNEPLDNAPPENDSLQEYINNEIQPILDSHDLDYMVQVAESCMGNQHDMIAKYWLYHAAKGGHETAKINLGGLFRYNIGFFKRIKLHFKAFFMGNVQANLNLGIIYAFGFGVNANHTKAKYRLNLAKSQGNEEAKFFHDNFRGLFPTSN